MVIFKKTVLCILRIIIGTFSGAIQPVSGAIISTSFVSFRSKAMSIFNWGIYLGFAASFGIAFITDQETWIYGYIVTGLSGLLVAVLLVLPAIQEYCSSKKSKPQGNIPEEGEALTDEVKENDIEKKQSWKDSVIGFFKNFVNFLDGKRQLNVI